LRSGPEDAGPDDGGVEQAEQDRRTAHVLGAFGQLVLFRGGFVHYRFQPGIQNFDDQDQDDAADPNGAVDTGFAKKNCQRYGDAGEQDFFAKAASFFHAARMPSRE
jgi:hypothetical protein